MRKAVLIVIILIVGTISKAQPVETNYLGTTVVAGYDDDSSYGPFNIGFTFNFYGNNYTQFYINTNGMILFGDGSSESGNVNIPGAELPNNFISAFWDDLVVDPTGKILYKTIGASPNRKLIIQYTNMGFYTYPVILGTFQIVLYETSNRIQIQYRLLADNNSPRTHGSTATIGLENSDGTIGSLYAFHNPTAVTTQQAISFSTSGMNYSINSNAIYDGVYLTTNLSLPEPGITNLINPPEDATIGSDQTFSWSESSNTSSYVLRISYYSDLSNSVVYNTGTNRSYNISGLALDTTLYWGVFATNTTGTTWCQIKKFHTSSAPPLEPVSQTIWTIQGTDKVIKLNYTGGNVSPKLAIVTSLPASGQLYQYNSGSRGAAISSIPATLTDPDRNVIYAASGSYGNNVGNFNFKINDSSGDSPEGTISINVSPPGAPNVMAVAKSTDVEIQFDLPMADPTGKQSQFNVTVNGLPAGISSASLKTGDNYTIVLKLVTPLTESDTVLVSYTQGNITSEAGGILFSFTDEPVNLHAQTITFSQSLSRKFSESPFVLTASASSNLGLIYSSSNLEVATINSNIATFRSLGSSTITAIQIGNGTFAPARFVKPLTVTIGDQVITFNALPVKYTTDADFNAGAKASSGLPISYSSSNPSVATVVNGLIHIVGVGTSLITASQPGNTNFNPATPITRTLTVQVGSKTLSLSSVFLQGLYDKNGTMRQAYDELGPHWPAGVADHITVELHDSANYATIIYTATDVALNSDGTALVTIPSAYSDSYYVTVRHRNSIETTSAVPLSFAGSSVNLSFSLPTDVYGGNMGISPDGRYVIFAGDVNQDGFIDTQDYIGVDNDSYNYAYGYLVTDVDGNGIVDTNDYIFIDNNNYNYVGSIHP